MGGKTWVLCDPTQVKTGSGDYQPAGPSAKYRAWKGKKWANSIEKFQEQPTPLKLEGVALVSQIHYWGHYPVVDLEFETDTPVSVGLRAWSSFLPGQVVDSMLPGIVFEVQGWEFPVEQSQTYWHSFLMRYEYVLPCPWQDKVPRHPDVTVKVTFTDELTGRQFTAQQVIKVSPPAAPSPPGPAATQPTANLR